MWCLFSFLPCYFLFFYFSILLFFFSVFSCFFYDHAATIGNMINMMLLFNKAKNSQNPNGVQHVRLIKCSFFCFYLTLFSALLCSNSSSKNAFRLNRSPFSLQQLCMQHMCQSCLREVFLCVLLCVFLCSISLCISLQYFFATFLCIFLCVSLCSISLHYFFAIFLCVFLCSISLCISLQYFFAVFLCNISLCISL